MMKQIKRIVLTYKKFIEIIVESVLCSLALFSVYKCVETMLSADTARNMLLVILVVSIFVYFCLAEIFQQGIDIINESLDTIKKWEKEWNRQYLAIDTIKDNLKMQNTIIREVIRSENGEETDIAKFEDVKSFATCMKESNSIMLDFVEAVLKNEESTQENMRDGDVL